MFNQLWPSLAMSVGALVVSSTALAQDVVCPADVVFTLDTSGSMSDEGAALCSTISQVQADLQAVGVNATSTLWGITGSSFPFGFDCLDDSVSNALGGTVPGDDGTCDGFLDNFQNQSNEESWGQSTAIVADRFPWNQGSVRVVVPISDEGGCNGSPCSDPGPDRDAVDNAIVVASDNNVYVSPVTGNGSSTCVQTLATDLAAGTGGTRFSSANASSDLAQGIEDIVIAACVAELQCRIEPELAVNQLGEVHEAVTTVSAFDGTGFSPEEGRSISIWVDEGPNAGTTILAESGIDGDVTLSYAGLGGRGVDVIRASCEDANGDMQPAASPALKFWDSDCNGNGVPDTCDTDCGGFGGMCDAFQTCGLSTDENADSRPDECSCIIGVNKVRFADRASTPSLIASYGTTELGVDASSTSIESSGKVTLRNRAQVDGDVVTGANVVEQNGAAVTGSITEFGSPNLPTVPTVGGPGYANGHLVVDSATTQTLTPGVYGNVTVNANATLVLDGAGEYGFKSLIVNSGASLDYDAGSSLFTHNPFIWRGEQIGDGPLPFGQTGGGWTHFEASWDGAVIAPNANIRLAGNGGPRYSGSEFVGKQILVEADTTVTCE